MKKKRLGRVLVVEDDAVLALQIEDALLDAGTAEVVICPTTKSAMEALETGRVDGIVLDVHLADRDDGWALAEMVDLIGPRRPRIVFSTGSPDDIPPRIAEMGAVLEKPYEMDVLVRLLSGRERKGLFARLGRQG